MAIDPEFQKKLQMFLVVAIVLAGGRAAYIVYERHEAMKEDAKPKQEMTLKADYYVTPEEGACLRSEVGTAVYRAASVGEVRLSAYVLSVRFEAA